MSSRSSSSDLSYGTETRYRTDTASDPLSEPLQTPLTPPPDPLDIHDDPPDPNRYSVVSISSLEPRRRHRSRHSGSLYNELSRMMSITEREAKEMRKGLSAALDKLEQSRARATHAERMALDMTQRVREANEHRLAATRQGQVTREELGMYKLQLSNAHAEIQRAQEMLRDQERMRHEAEASAARARDTARKLNQDRLIDLAREEGRKNGYREGLSVGQRIGRYDGGLDMDYEGTPRGRDTLTGMLPDTNYLDDLYANDFGENNARPDAAPPSRFVEELESMNGTAPPATPPLRRRLIHEFQRSDQPPTPAPQMPIGQPITDTYSFPPHTPIHVRQPSSEASVASSSSLPAAPMHPGNRIVSSGPTMPTIPEVVNTEPSSSRPSSRRRSNAAGASQDTFFGGDLGRDGFPAMEQMQDGAGAPVYPMPPFDPYRSPHRGHISVNRPPPDEDLDTAGPYVFAVPPPGSVDGFASPRAGASIRREFSPPPPPVMNDYGSQGPADQRTFTPPRPESFADQPTGRTFDPPPPGTVNDGFGNRSARGRSITREFSPPPPGSFAMPSGGHVPAGYGAPPDPYSSRFSGEMSNQHPRTNGAGRSHEENQRMADILVRHPDSSERPLSQQVATPPRSGPPRRRPQVKMPDRLGPVNPQEMYRRPESSAHARSQSAYGSEGGRREYATQRADSLHRRSSSAAAPEVYIQTPISL
ncbi:hypothetical protein FA95DRAFT_398249 [Auriscalpium vulgare]|uniref:Uncharacterized protein n=1 Tax=Auriscalpium vulgare TaxID=40419 RepID=A0ACB8RHS0_9AGAM|nr:hypothetical protein FA95DRAFT_398249 [Auriscalpium vulgare]